ncbi:MAG: acetyl-CoA carboxylase carboxyltransferase subunit alpha [Elusimicrobia bacterium RIFOXYB2_FULL_48_7]|nr:MAG: acetyl-CoA carboxylase carboxyltransferase subunit alpha [Elusimicrobia bacterium RIFOXYB2_FULL_48_7]
MAEDFQGLDFEQPIIELENKIAELKKLSENPAEIKTLEEKCNGLKLNIYKNITPAQRVKLARHPKRPYSLDYINLIFSDFTELHGDRNFSDDKALVTGFANLDTHPVAIIAQQKGRELQEKMDRNFGSMHPEGYRKALRVMKLAEKFRRPVICFIDTMGAYPGIGAEERGQAEAIARNLREMSILETPLISIIIGEGGSGGALGIGVTDRILMLENAWYSVISPEGCASILFHDSSRYAEAAEAMKITAPDLYQLKTIDEIIPEPLGGANRDIAATADAMKKSLIKNLAKLNKMKIPELLKARYKKYRILGNFTENSKKNQLGGNK